MRHSVWEVDAKDMNRRSPNRGAADQNGAIPAEVVLPFVAARIEEPGSLPGPRVDSRKVGSLVVVTRDARQGKVAGAVAAAVLLGNHVVDLVKH